MFEVSFRAQHECPYIHFSVRHPEVRIAEWCNRRTDVLEIDCQSAETFTRIDPDLRKLLLWRGARILKKTFGERNTQVITKTCRDTKISTTISGTIVRNSCLAIPPVIYHGGWETHRVIGFRESDYKKLFRDLNKLGPIEILSKKLLAEKSIQDTFVISLGTVFSGTTDKQIQAIAVALDCGYYNVPRKVTIDEIARKLGVPRTTYDEHLRKAETKVLHALAPFIMLRAHGPSRTTEAAQQIRAR
jgi:predicted DNA binding protein